MSRFLLTQAPRHLPPWLIFGVRQNMKKATFTISDEAYARLCEFATSLHRDSIAALIWGATGRTPDEMIESVVVGAYSRRERDESWTMELRDLAISVSPDTESALRGAEVGLARLPQRGTLPAMTYFERIRK